MHRQNLCAKFELIKQTIEYAKAKVDNSRLSFAMTTNCTIMTQEMSDYLVQQPEMFITVSLDGPRNIHDQYRVYQNQRGSFDDTMRGVKLLYESSRKIGKHFGELISVNTVIEYPETEEKFEQIQKFFKEDSHLWKGVQINYSYASHGPEAYEYKYPNSEEEATAINELYKNHASVTEWTLKCLKDKKFQNDLQGEQLFSFSDINEMLVITHKRGIIDNPCKNYRLNACCIPGSRRLYIETNGDFKPCERVGFSPVLGNINTGFDFVAIKKYYFDEFAKCAANYCNHCWACNVCGVCYMDAFDENGVNMEYRHRHCETYRRNLSLAFSLYHEILEKNPTSLKYLNDVVFN